MVENLVEAHLGEVADGRGEGRDLGDRLGAGLEALGADMNSAESIVTVVIIDPPVSTGGGASRRSDFPRGRRDRWARAPCGRITPRSRRRGAEVDGHVRHGLARVEDDVRTDLAGTGDEPVDGVDRAEDVGDMREREHLRRLIDDRLEVGQVELSGVGHRDPPRAPVASASRFATARGSRGAPSR